MTKGERRKKKAKPVSIKGLNIVWMRGLQKRGLRVACVQLKRVDFENNTQSSDTQRMVGIVPALKEELGANAPDLVIFPEQVYDAPSRYERNKRRRLLKEIAIRTNIAIGFCEYSAQEIFYIIIQPTGKMIKFKKYNYRKEKRIFSIKNYNITVLICAEVDDVIDLQDNDTKETIKNIEDADLVIVPAHANADYANFWVRKLYERFKHPVAVVNRTGSTSTERRISIFMRPNRRKVSLPNNKEAILMVDIPRKPDTLGVQMVSEEISSRLRAHHPESALYTEASPRAVTHDMAEFGHNRLRFITGPESPAGREEQESQVENPTAEEVFSKIYNLKLKIFNKERDILAARIVDALGIGEGDNVLDVGPGSVEVHAVACAIKGPKVDILQPHFYKKSPQTTYLERYILDDRNIIINLYGKDLIGDRIDTKNHQGLAHNVALPAKHYSFVFLLNVLEVIFSIPVKLALIQTFLFSLRDKATILISAYCADINEQIEFLQKYAEMFGYSVEVGRQFAGEQTVWELKVTKQRQIGDGTIIFSSCPRQLSDFHSVPYSDSLGSFGRGGARAALADEVRQDLCQWGLGRRRAGLDGGAKYKRRLEKILRRIGEYMKRWRRIR